MCWLRWTFGLWLAWSTFACDERPERPKPADAVAELPRPPAPATTPATTQGPPDLAIDNISPKVGFARASFLYPDGQKKLALELGGHREFLEGKEVVLRVDRKAKQEWVAAYLIELGRIGVPKVTVKTETRSEYPSEVVFTPEPKLVDPPACSPVAGILEDRSTAVWKLSGGAAGRRPKGMAGPDLSMTGESLERVGKACKLASPLFVYGAKDIEWGLVFDLAASSKTLSGVHFDSAVLLSILPVPGHKVALAK
jgi:hypothetical protein